MKERKTMSGRFVMTHGSVVRYQQQVRELSENGRELARLLHNSAVPHSPCPVGGIAAPIYVALAYEIQTNAAHRSMVGQVLDNMRRDVL